MLPLADELDSAIKLDLTFRCRTFFDSFRRNVAPRSSDEENSCVGQVLAPVAVAVAFVECDDRAFAECELLCTGRIVDASVSDDRKQKMGSV